MFKELDAIVLTSEIPLDHIWDVPPGSPLVENGSLRKGLQAGDVGSIVYMQGNGEKHLRWSFWNREATRSPLPLFGPLRRGWRLARTSPTIASE